MGNSIKSCVPFDNCVDFDTDTQKHPTHFSMDETEEQKRYEGCSGAELHNNDDSVSEKTKKSIAATHLFGIIWHSFFMHEENKCEYMDYNNTQSDDYFDILDHILVQGGCVRDVLWNMEFNDVDAIVNTRELNKLHVLHLKKFHSTKERQDNSKCILWLHYAKKFEDVQTSEETISDFDVDKTGLKIIQSGYMLNAKYLVEILQNDPRPTMLKALKDIENKIKTGGGYSIQKVLRKKNLFRDYNFKNPQYCDVKLNVEIFHKGVESISIVAEIQVMVQFMNTFKREISHKLYQIQRQEEHFDKMTKIAKKLTEFEPNFTAILASGKVKDLCKFMIEHMMDASFLINYRFKNDSNIFHALFRFDNISLYEYITRKSQAKPPTLQLLRDKFQERDTSDLLEESFKNKNGGGSPIYEALNSNSEQILNLLCEQFPDLIINFFDERTHLKAIHYASFKGNPKLLQFLFKNAPTDAEECDNWIMSKENDGTTVFQWAANKGMLFAMKKCWNNLSNIKIKKEMILGEQDAGRTAFFYAVVGDHLQTAEWLLSLCDDDEERSKMIRQKVDKPRVTIIEWMETRNRFPSMVKRIQAWMKIYPLK